MPTRGAANNSAEQRLALPRARRPLRLWVDRAVRPGTAICRNTHILNCAVLVCGCALASLRAKSLAR
eukprot:scaffold947_cov375-Prasinococcus_capsulatus_cf.AAC.1